jgi:hypothetical protein
MMRCLFAAAAVLTLAGCSCGSTSPTQTDSGIPLGGDGGADAGADGGGLLPDGGPIACLEGLTAVSLAPANSTVEVDATAPAPITFHATGSFSTGSRDITHAVSWSVTRDDDTPPGTISDGVYQPTAGSGGKVTVHATEGCQPGQTDVSLHLATTFQDPGPATTGRFDGGVVTSGAAVPTFVYPNDQTRFPRNIYKVLFQWKKNGDDFFKLTFAGPYSQTVVYTDGNDAACAAVTGAGCWQADATSWAAIAGSNAGELTNVTLEGVAPSDPNVYRAPDLHLGFSRRDVRGAIFYWSTDSAGIRRASVSDAQPEPYVVAKPTATTLGDGSTVKCVACHTVSRSGKKIVAGTQTSTATGEFVYDVTDSPPPTVVLTNQLSTQNKGFGTFSPDDSRVVATTGNTLAEFNASSGAHLANLSPVAATNPDWSPAGDLLAYSSKAGDSPKSADLMVLDYLGNDTWGSTPRTLVPAAGLTNLFPSFSPDGQYIAYSRGNGGHSDSTYDLYLISADGGTPVHLMNANHAINNDPALTTGSFENNMPTWAPSGDLLWVAFNSARPYGLLTAAGTRQQIWVTAIDPAKLGTGEDPSYPAFRFAFQDLSENNHRAFWSEDVRFPPDAGIPDAGPADAGTQDAGVCVAYGQACDQAVNNCCAGLVCDLPFDGGTQTYCHAVIN